MIVVHLDYETRSVSDIKLGAYRYAADPTTEILMAGVSEDGPEKPVYLWVNPKFQTGDSLSDPEALELLRRADVIFCHNSGFEAAICWALAQKTFGFSIPIGKFRCTAAMARKAGLPYSLEKAAESLGISEQKDGKGKRLIQLFSVPQKDGTFIQPRDRPDDWMAFCDYCKQDVRAEKGVHVKLKAFELQGEPLETFLFDLRMNQLGVPVNVPALRQAQRLIDAVQLEVGVEFRRLTGLNPTQRQKVLELVQSLGVDISNMQGDTIDEISIPSEVHKDPKALRILELYQKLSYAAVKKVRTMLDCACPDDRVRGCQMYYGAGTGRWSGKLIQPHNLKRPPAWMKGGTTDAVYKAISEGISHQGLDVIYGDPLESLSGCIRHFFHFPGNEMFDGDYNAIEGRIGCWIAGQKDILEEWRKGTDLYVRAAAAVEDLTEAYIHALPKEEKAVYRNFGKVVELAAQFGLGDDGFIRTCENFNVSCDREKAHKAVHGYYRPTHDKIVNRWWFLDDCMRKAIACPGTQHGPFSVRRVAGILYMFLKLPSGRSLAYPHIEINKRLPTPKEKAEMAAGKNYPEKRFLEITYWGNIKGTTWGRVKLHGAKAFENEVQAIAADVIAHGGKTAEKRGMPPFMFVHDQALAIRDGQQRLEDYIAAFTDLPHWAAGLPLKFEAKIAPYYSK